MIGARCLAVWNILIFAGDSDFWLIALILWLKIRNSYSSCNSFLGLFFTSAIRLFHRVNCRSVRSGISVCNYYRHLHNSAGTIWVCDFNRYISCASLSCSWKRIVWIYKLYFCIVLIWSLTINRRNLYSFRDFISSRCWIIALLVDGFCAWLVGLVIWIANCYRNFHVILRTVWIGNSNLNVYGSRSLSVDRLIFINCNFCISWLVWNSDFSCDFFMRRFGFTISNVDSIRLIWLILLILRLTNLNGYRCMTLRAILICNGYRNIEIARLSAIWNSLIAVNSNAYDVVWKLCKLCCFAVLL